MLILRYKQYGYVRNSPGTHSSQRQPLITRYAVATVISSSDSANVYTVESPPMAEVQSYGSL